MIDTNKVCELFDGRARGLYGVIPTLNIAMFQEKHGDLARQRDEVEFDTVMGIIKPYLTKETMVLDIGCGTGRWAFHLSPFVGYVEGFDISPAMIEICEKEAIRQEITNVSFYVASIDEARCNPSFDVVMLAGVSVYTNDEQWSNIYALLTDCVHKGSIIVVREPCGSVGRYEIHDRWSEELGVYYSAIYRDPDWFHGVFGTFCRRIHSAPLFPPELEKWKETHQHLFVFEVL